GLYPCPDLVEAVLQPIKGHTRRILDLGCGTGAWAVQMATRFPHADVLGIDLAPGPIGPSGLPPNLAFEIDDIRLDLSHFTGRFDLVHMRYMSAELEDIRGIMFDVQRCLKPGGVIIVLDGEITIKTEDRGKPVAPGELLGDAPAAASVGESGASFRRLNREACEVCITANAHLTPSPLVDDQQGFWASSYCDPDTCLSGSIDVPIVPWAKTDDEGGTRSLQYVGLLMRQNALSINCPYHLNLLKHENDQRMTNRWSGDMDKGKTNM
ncbi:hypothetical protein M408DRAFT_78716, partial [Serendipita vermifera MAFF 305830]